MTKKAITPALKHEGYLVIARTGPMFFGSTTWKRPRSTADPLEIPSALDVQGLVDGFMGDAHRWIIGEVDPQAMGNLLR